MDRNSAIGRTWDELQKELFTPEEIAASERWVAAKPLGAAEMRMPSFCKSKSILIF